MDDDRTREPQDPNEPAPDETTDGFDFLTRSFEEVEETVEAELPVAASEPLLAAVPEPDEAEVEELPVALARPFAVVPPSDPEDLPEPEELPERVAVEPEPEPEPVAAVAEPEPVDAWEAAPAAPSALDLLVEEPEAQPEAAKVPWYKREIGGKKKDDTVAETRAERRPKRRLRPEPEAPAEEPSLLKREVSLKKAAAAPEAGERVPFYRRELSIGRKKAAAPVEVAALEVTAVEEPAEPAERVPFYKREVSFGRKKAEAAAPVDAAHAREHVAVPGHERETRFGRRRTRVAPAAAPEAVTVAEAPTEERKPLYRRELSIRRREKPAVAQAPAEPKEQEEPKAKRAPKVRRQLSLPKLQLPVRNKGGTGVAGKRHKKLVGLKIGASQLAAAEVVNNGHAELVRVARDSLVDGIVSGGELRDPDALTLALRHFFKANKLPKRNVRLGIANNRIGVRTFEITGIDDAKQLANAVRFRAQEALPIPIEEAVIDWRILSESTDEEGQLVRRILLVVAYRELVDRYVAACRRAGIQLVGIDLEAFALLRALGDGDRRATDDGALVAVSVGHERSTFAVSDGEICEFTRVLEWGGNSLNVAIARALDKAPSEVEQLKRALALEGESLDVEGFEEDVVATAKDAVRRQLQTFARELVSSLQFYQNQPGSLGIGEIILTGGTAQMPGLARELERLIGVRVRVGDPLRRVRASKRVPTDELGSLSVAIGLGIED